MCVCDKRQINMTLKHGYYNIPLSTLSYQLLGSILFKLNKIIESTLYRCITGNCAYHITIFI